VRWHHAVRHRIQMLDDVDRTEVGKLRNDFLTDDQGRRIYCTPFASARWVPSLEEEEMYRGLGLWVTLAGGAATIAGTTALIFLWDEPYTTFGAWVMLALVARFVCVSLFVRRWPAIPEGEFSYGRYVMSVLERRSLPLLCLAVLLRAVACVGFAVGPIWLVIHFPINWSDLTVLKMVVFAGPPLLLTLAAPYLALSTYRAASVLRKRMLAAAA
jgi:hypothetical protein